MIDQVLLPPTPSNEPLEPEALIELAIERAVPLFNNGNPAACAAVDEITVEALRNNARAIRTITRGTRRSDVQSACFQFSA